MLTIVFKAGRMTGLFRLLIVALTLLSGQLSLAANNTVDFTGFELGTRDDIQSGAGTNSILCPARGNTNGETMLPYSGECMGRIAPTGTGVGSFRVGKVGPDGNVTTTIATDDAYYEARFAVKTAPASGSEEIFSSWDNASTPVQKGAVRIDSTRKLAIYNAAGTLVATGTTVLALNTYYRVEVKICTGASCTVEVKLNNVLEVSGTSNFGTGKNGSARWGKQTDRNGQTVSYFFDDLVNDSQDWIGNVRVGMLLPSDVGDINQWTDGTPPSDWSQVNATSAGGTSLSTAKYVRNTGSVLNEEIKINFQSRSSVGITGSIRSVKAVVHASKDVSGTTPLPYVILQSGGNYNVSGTPSGSINDLFTRAWLLNTSPFSSGDWAPDELDDIQAGVGNGALAKIRAHSITVMVLYDETGIYNTPTPAPTYIPPTPPIPPYVKVFPGSTGYPDAQVAGSGRHLGTPSTTIYRVTSLANEGAGTLRECMEAIGPRTCVFEVAGYIDWAVPAGRSKADVLVTSPYLTVAGQTAPSPGIHARNARVNISTHDVLFMHFAIRPGDAEAGSLYTERDAITITPNGGPVYNINLDHMSLTYAIDEEVSTSGGTGETIDNISITNSIMGNGLASGIRTRYSRACSDADCVTGGSLCTSVRSPGQAVNCTDYKQNHGLGTLIYPTARMNWHNNIYSQHYERNMRTYGNTSLEFINNIVYGWGGTSCSSTWNCLDTDPARPCKLYLYGNYFKKRVSPASPHCPILNYGTVPASSRAFLSHNICPTRPTDTGNDWLCSAWPTSMQVFAPPFADSGSISPKDPNTMFTDLTTGNNVLNGGVGARPWNRYVGDTDIINEVKNGTGTLKDCVSNCLSTERPVFGTVGASTGWPSIGTGSRTLSQLDEVGWNANTVESNGRTALENYIYAFSDDGDPSGYPIPVGTPTPTPTSVGTNTPTPTPTSAYPLPGGTPRGLPDAFIRDQLMARGVPNEPAVFFGRVIPPNYDNGFLTELKFESGAAPRLVPYSAPLALTPSVASHQFKVGPNVVATAAANAAGILPTPAAVGQQVTVINSNTSNSIRIKAGPGNSINGSASGAYIPAPAKSVTDCYSSTLTEWSCGLKVIPTPGGP